MKISSLKEIYNLDQVVFYEGRLFERLPVKRGFGILKYRVIISPDYYDYVVSPALRKRLDRLFKRLEK